MNDNYERSIREAVSAIRIYSPTGYHWFGAAGSRLSAQMRRILTPQQARDYLLYDLTSRLYNDYYLRGFAAPATKQASYINRTGFTPFVAKLSAANCGTGNWDEGWQVLTVGRDWVDVFRNDLRLRAPLHSCAVIRGARVEPGETARLRFPKERLGISPGFYMILSDVPFCDEDLRALVRFYWNLNAEAAVRFVEFVTRLLNDAKLPFRLKILNDHHFFTRCDAAVIYLARRDYATAAKLLDKVYTIFSDDLQMSVPAFTKPLAAGAGFAEDPGGGESFGQSRCRLLADAVIRAYEHGKKSVDDRMQVVIDRYAAEGVSLARPFLCYGGQDSYMPFADYPKEASIHFPNHERRVHGDYDAAMFLESSAEVGLRLSREAVWYSGECNWLGANPADAGRYADSFELTYSALGPDLYAGTSGIGLFLAELYARSGTSEARRTAIGAIRQALSHSDELLARASLGLYTGAIGVALATARVGAALGEQEFLDKAARLLRQCLERRDVYEFDLLSGLAGAVVALLALRDLLSDTSLLDVAAMLGSELVENADVSGDGLSWTSRRRRYRHNLTGFSHGTAGIGWALLELSQATACPKYRRAAERAFEYERQWFDAESGNWPDFREVQNQARLGRRWPCATTWCHGAPGIALARLRAYELTGDTTYRDEARVAMRTTYASLASGLHSGDCNFSLCHGIFGLAEVLLYGRDVLGREWEEESVLAFDAAERGLERARRHEGAWSCGVVSGETPSLLLGLAGIGFFYLRLHSPTFSPILMLRQW